MNENVLKMLLSMLIIDIVFVAGGKYNSEMDISNISIPTQIDESNINISINSMFNESKIETKPQIIEKPYPEPNYKPSMRPYKIDKSHDIWHAQDPKSYITPQNEWVLYYASQLYINEDGRIRYKDTKVPWVTDLNGNVVSWIDKPFVNNYISDDAQFNYPPNGDMWVMPDYYLTNGMKDDCDGWAITVASLLLSGELSIKIGENFTKQIIPAKVVIGYAGPYRDAWVEYKVYNKTFYSTTASIITGLDGKEKISATIFDERKNETNIRPILEFTNKQFGRYNNLSLLNMSNS